jgi:hypothetical protein
MGPARNGGAAPSAGAKPRPPERNVWHLDRHLDARELQLLLGRVAATPPTEAQAARLLAAMQPAAGGAGGGRNSGGDGAPWGVLPLHAVLQAVWPARPSDASQRLHAALEEMAISIEIKMDDKTRPAVGS